jgi:hypothetical protein
MSEAITTEQENLRKAMLVPCESKEDLHDWIRVYLGLDLPDCIVDADSTTSPMDAIWTIYDAFRTSQVQASRMKKQFTPISRRSWTTRAATRFKTLGAAVLEVVVMLHHSLSVAHMAAIERQAKKSQQYVRDFMSRRTIIRDYVTVQNETRVEITRFTHRETKIDLTPDEYAGLTVSEQTALRPEVELHRHRHLHHGRRQQRARALHGRGRGRRRFQPEASVRGGEAHPVAVEA